MSLMSTLACVALTLAIATACVSAHPSWEQWKHLHNKKYASQEEDSRRQQNYNENLRFADEMARKNPHATFGANHFSDLSAAEFKVYHNADSYFAKNLAKKSQRETYTVTADDVVNMPQSQDWRSKGAVTYVKNQGQCGSCWSFSTTGNIEGQWFLAGNTLVAVSEQELVSCDTTCSACNGGLMDDAFQWIISNNGGWITGENDYPYVSGAGQVPACSMSGMPNVAQIVSYKDLPQNENQMAAWLSTGGPVSIGVDATSWQSYTGGVLTNCVSQQVDHGVLAVGYDLTANPQYWIIKNSWAASWGESGYIRVQFGTDQCLITSAPSSSKASGNPNPPPPPPGPTPQPPTPPSPPSGTGSFTQEQCDDSACSQGCQSQTFPTGQCLQMSGGGSAIADCGASELTLQIYQTSTCTGSYQQQQQPLDQCLQDTSGTYIMDTCSGGSNSGSSHHGSSGSHGSSQSHHSSASSHGSSQSHHSSASSHGSSSSHHSASSQSSQGGDTVAKKNGKRMVEKPLFFGRLKQF